MKPFNTDITARPLHSESGQAASQLAAAISAAGHKTGSGSSRFGAFVALTKPRLTMLSVLTAAAAYYLGAQARPDLWWGMLHLVLATLLVGGGCGALNMYMEREYDSAMKRTSHRPIPSGRVTPTQALVFGLVLSSLGTSYLVLAANPLAGILGALTIVSYVIVYTPLKRHSTLNTLVGALPGALPPAIGWVAATGNMSTPGWTLFGILFLWQMPHFLSFAWMYRNDYQRAGYVMLSTVDDTGRKTGLQNMIYTIALVALSIVPSYTGMAGMAYLISAAVLGAVFLALGLLLALRKNNADARTVFLYSLIYLPILLVVLVADRI